MNRTRGALDDEELAKVLGGILEMTAKPTRKLARITGRKEAMNGGEDDASHTGPQYPEDQTTQKTRVANGEKVIKMADQIAAGEEITVTNASHLCMDTFWAKSISEKESFSATFQDFMFDFYSVAVDISIICGWALRACLVVKFAIKLAREIMKRFAERKNAKKKPRCLITQSTTRRQITGQAHRQGCRNTSPSPPFVSTCENVTSVNMDDTRLNIFFEYGTTNTRGCVNSSSNESPKTAASTLPICVGRRVRSARH